MGILITIGEIVAQIANLMPQGVSIEQNAIQAWQALKPLVGGSIPPDPSGQDLADLDAKIVALAVAAHAAWHRGDADAPAPVSQPDGHAD
jgi:hypothetical protein